jgi:dimethylglycine dehydrogenase
MARILIVGAGQAGLQLALGLVHDGHDVTVVSNRTPEEIRDGKVMSSQCMFGAALQHEHELGIDYWYDEQLLTERGGIQADVTVTLLEPGVYYVVSAAAAETHDLAWLQAHQPDEGAVRVENVTARRAVLTIAGPRSRELLQRVSGDDFSNGVFPFFRARDVQLGKSPALALRVSYVGELGWELHHPIEHQSALYDLLFEAGEDLGIADFGYRALESMRLEKAYRLWGVDMSPDWTPLQAGLERFVAFDKGDFIGRDALLAEKEQGSTHSLSCLRVDANGTDAHGYEPIWAHSGAPVAYVAAGGYGHTIRTSIALAYLPIRHAAVGTELEVTIHGERRPATVTEQPLFDPEGTRLLS